MNTVSLVLRSVAIIAGISAGALFFVSKGKLKEANNQLVSTQGTLTATTTELSDTKAQVADATGKLKTAQRQAERLSTQLETARTEADTSRRELNSSQDKLTTASSEITTLEESLTQLKADMQTANNALIAADKTAELSSLGEKVASLTTENQNLKDELNVAESKLKSYTVGREKKTPTALSSLNTSDAVRSAKLAENVTIASVNSGSGIVVLDAAPELGLEPGMNVTLIQDLMALGKVRVAQVDNNLAVANILPGTTANSLQEGAVVDILR